MNPNQSPDLTAEEIIAAEKAEEELWERMIAKIIAPEKRRISRVVMEYEDDFDFLAKRGNKTNE